MFSNKFKVMHLWFFVYFFSGTQPLHCREITQNEEEKALHQPQKSTNVTPQELKKPCITADCLPLPPNLLDQSKDKTQDQMPDFAVKIIAHRDKHQGIVLYLTHEDSAQPFSINDLLTSNAQSQLPIFLHSRQIESLMSSSSTFTAFTMLQKMKQMIHRWVLCWLCS